MARLAICVLTLALTLGACTPAGGSVDGPQIFRTICAACHGLAGKPDEGMVAHLGVRDLTAAEFRARVTPALVEAQVRAGSKNQLMPAFEGKLTDEQIKAVAAYVASHGFVK